MSLLLGSLVVLLSAFEKGLRGRNIVANPGVRGDLLGGRVLCEEREVSVVHGQGVAQVVDGGADAARAAAQPDALLASHQRQRLNVLWGQASQI